jgi:carbamoyltransferase
MSNYIGLANSFHDSAIAIVSDTGEVLFAEASERYLQNKRSIGIAPDLFMRTAELVETYCDPDADIVLATTWSEASRHTLREGLERTQTAAQQYRKAFGPPTGFVRRQLAGQALFHRAQLAMVEHPGLLLEFDLAHSESFGSHDLQWRGYEHHLTHAAAGCFSSTFDEAVCAVLDGMGEQGAFACYRYRDGQLTEIETDRAGNRASLGTFYTMVCEACGFGPMSGEEWKVMGLASYGRHDPELCDLLREMIRVDGLSLRFQSPARATQLLQRLYDIRRRPGTPAIQCADLARAGQQVFTEVLEAFLGNLHALGHSDNLVLAGGCALNSSANGRILGHTPFRCLHVFCAPGDDGNAVGAALLAHREDHPHRHGSPTFFSPYIGSTMSRLTLEHVERFGGLDLVHCHGDAPQRAARLLAEGRIIGWIQGCAEYGPRALGNRSILADPRREDIKDIINARVKFREEFRPFAPSILHEYGPAYFEDYQESPYMERTLRFRPEVVRQVPGVVHHDGTGRLQTVKEMWNPRYHSLISEFYRLTEVPLILNTSFNVMSKPISHSVEDALAVFFTSGLDALFIDDILIVK